VLSLNQIIDINSIRRFVRKRDLWKEGAENHLKIEELLDDNIVVSPSSLNFSNIGDFMIANDLVTKLILRKINYIICTIYRVKQSNRNYITNDLKHILIDKTPVFIIKTDIHSFYESIDVDRLLNKLEREKIISFNVMEYIRSIFDGKSKGLPRGLNISAGLSELYMKDFDTKMKVLDKIGYYARYVDDIILVFYSNKKEFDMHFLEQNINGKMNILKSCLTGLKLEINRSKTHAFYCKGENRISFAYSNKNGGTFITNKKPISNIEFDYLGYRYLLNKKYELKINIAKRKINKIKSRIYNSFLLYSYDMNFEILEKRIQYLFSNYPIYESDEDKLYAGIYYNYPHCESDNEFLIVIECFYKKILSKYRFCLCSGDYKKLKDISITAGYSKKIMKKFNHDELHNILSGLKHYE
jgi:hypothetical protein